jgi:hypothetical protein
LEIPGKTIEFRQHKGTLDPERIKNWVRFVVALAKAAKDTPERAISNLLRRLIDLPGEFRILNFIRSSLSMIPEAASYREEALRKGCLFNYTEIFFVNRRIMKPGSSFW